MTDQLRKHLPGEHDQSDHGNRGRPPRVGEVEIPDGAVRLYHYTHSPEDLDSIKEKGLLQDKAKGESYGEPSVVWASFELPRKEMLFVEFWAMPDEIGIGGPISQREDHVEQWREHAKGVGSNVTLIGDVPADRITTIHEPWMDAYDYLTEDEDTIRQVVAGDFDHAIAAHPLRYQRAIQLIKEQYGDSKEDKHLPGEHDQREHGNRKNPKGVETVTVEYLKRGGFEAYVVGGTVRDFLLGRTPKDIDVTTSAEPEEVVAMFEEAGYRVIPSGLQHGTVTVLDPDHGPIEITTYRTDGDYSDGRRPDEVKFTKDLREDLSRRDLTINAIAYDSQTGEIVDPFDGQADIESRTIRAVGNAKKRFLEDGLRPLRAARFASVLGFDIHPSTLDAMKDSEVHEKFRSVSKERINDEVMKSMRGDNPRKFIELLLDTGLIDNVIPELKPQVGLRQPEKYHAHDVIGHSLAALDAMTAYTSNPVLRLISVLHDIGKPERYGEKPDGTPQFLGHDAHGADVITDVMERLKFPRKDIDRAAHLVRHHLFMISDKMSKAAVRRFIERVGEENLDDLYAVRRADLIGHGTQAGMDTLAEVDRFLQRYAGMKEAGEDQPKALAVNGRDLIDELGITEGPDVGRAMRAIKEAVTEDPSLNTREDLLRIARGNLSKHLPGEHDQDDHGNRAIPSDIPDQSDHGNRNEDNADILMSVKWNQPENIGQANDFAKRYQELLDDNTERLYRSIEGMFDDEDFNFSAYPSFEDTLSIAWPENYDGMSHKEQKARAFVKANMIAWERGDVFEEPRNVALQRAAYEEFGQPDEEWETFFRELEVNPKDKAEKTYKKMLETQPIEVFRAFLREQYEQTQAALKRMGVEGHVRLYRGMEGDEDFEDMNPLSSWTPDKESASKFGKLVYADIPVEDIASIPWRGMGTPFLGEVLVVNRGDLSYQPPLLKHLKGRHDQDDHGNRNEVSTDLFELRSPVDAHYITPDGDFVSVEGMGVAQHADVARAVLGLDDGVFDDDAVRQLVSAGYVRVGAPMMEGGEGYMSLPADPTPEQMAGVRRFATSVGAGSLSIELEGGDMIYSPDADVRMLFSELRQTMMRRRARLAKARVYLYPGEQPPLGVNVEIGPRGGKYYDTERDLFGAGKDDPRAKNFLPKPPKPGRYDALDAIWFFDSVMQDSAQQYITERQTRIEFLREERSEAIEEEADKIRDDKNTAETKIDRVKEAIEEAEQDPDVDDDTLSILWDELEEFERDFKEFDENLENLEEEFEWYGDDEIRDLEATIDDVELDQVVNDDFVQSRWKAEVVQNLTSRLEHGRYNQERLRRGAEAIGTSISRAVDVMIESWAISSSNGPLSNLIQNAASTMFGLPPLPAFTEDVAAGVREYMEFDRENEGAFTYFLGAYVEQVYESTQELLAENMVEELSVTRGMKWDSPEKVPVWAREAPEEAIVVSSNPLSSFSANTATAMAFSGGKHSIRLSATIPREQIFSTPMTGMGCLGEYEVVVIGGRHKVKADIHHQDKPWDEDESEAAA